MSREPMSAMRGVVPFSRLSDTELKEVIGALEMCSMEDGEYIFKEGDKAHAMYVILEGAIEVIKGDRIIAEIPRKTVVGEIGLLTAHHYRTATARTKGITVLLKWESSDFHERLAAEEPAALKVAVDLAYQLAERLKRMTEEFMKLHDAAKRPTPKTATEFEEFKNRMLNEVFF